MQLWNETVLPALRSAVQEVIGILPQILGAVLIIVLGWLVSKIAGSLVGRLLNRLGLNKAAERTGVSSFLTKAGFTHEISWIVGRLVFWTLMLVFLLSASETLHLNALAETLQVVVAFVPNLLVAVLVLVLGAFLARIIGRLARGAAAEGGIGYAVFLEKAVNAVVLIAVIIIATSQLKIQSDVLEIAFGIALGACGLVVALTLGLGTRRIAQSITCGVYVRRSFKIGQSIKVEGEEGEIVEFGPVNTVIQTSKGLVSLPNSFLIDGVVRIADDRSDVL
jgi:hypothetical protein